MDPINELFVGGLLDGIELTALEKLAAADNQLTGEEPSEDELETEDIAQEERQEKTASDNSSSIDALVAKMRQSFSKEASVQEDSDIIETLLSRRG